MKFILVAVISLLFACGNDSERSQVQKKSAVFETQLKAIDKAKGVEEMLQKSVDERDKDMRNKGI